MIRCWPIIKTVKTPVSLSHVRRPSRLHRIAAVATSKPAIIGWLCIATVGLIPPLFVAPTALPAAVSGNTGPVATSPWAGADVLPLPTGWEIIGQPVRLPELPSGLGLPPSERTPVPEPSSLALLAMAIAAMVWRFR